MDKSKLIGSLAVGGFGIAAIVLGTNLFDTCEPVTYLGYAIGLMNLNLAKDIATEDEDLELAMYRTGRFLDRYNLFPR